MAIRGRLGTTLGGRSGTMITIDRSFFRELEEFIDDNRHIVENVKWATDKIIMGYAYVIVGAAQKRSAGPIDPQMKGYVTALKHTGNIGHAFSPRHYVGGKAVGSSSGFYNTAGAKYKYTQSSAGAWKIPVRRITGAYYAGWYAERLSPSVWMVSNKSREAYYIEFGINHAGTGLHSTGGRVRIRRPVLKLSVMEAMSFAAGTDFDIKAIAGLWRGRGSATHSPLLNPHSGVKSSTGSFFLSGAIGAE